MVNWDPSAQTALSDEEVIHKEVDSKLYHISYDLEDSNEKITIATTRPETILGDSAICINPNDNRFTHLKGKRAIVPLINRSIPIMIFPLIFIFSNTIIKTKVKHPKSTKGFLISPRVTSVTG